MNIKQVEQFLYNHLKSIYDGDFDTYKRTTSEDLGLYEWFVSPHRIDGIDFHRFMMTNNWAKTKNGYNIHLQDLRIQIYNNTAIASYTLLLSVISENGIEHKVINESRVIIKTKEGLKVVHVHKSPAGK
ncbi:MAG: nuclear transport factor 2 family protein [Calditerrivibrio sp.]|nr:nuclear transport factor 2 family protein [Calditerrivibrio sp.]